MGFYSIYIAFELFILIRKDDNKNTLVYPMSSVTNYSLAFLAFTIIKGHVTKIHFSTIILSNNRAMRNYSRQRA